MARPLVSDFALTTLNNIGGSMSATATSFTVTSGGGNAFPDPSASNLPVKLFVVTIDNELVLCSNRVGDTFTVWTDSFGHTGRGYAGTTAAIHTNGASIVLSLTANHLRQLWSSLPDTFDPDVPVGARGTWNSSKGYWDYTSFAAPGAYDEEFEAPFSGWGSPWNWSPRPSSITAPDGSTGTDSGLTANWNTVLKSQLYCQRADNNTEKWYLWRSFAPGGGAWTVRAKIGHGGAFVADALEFGMGVSNQSNPTAGGGTAIALAHSIANTNSENFVGHSASYTAPAQLWLTGYTVSGTGGTSHWQTFSGEHYVQIVYDGIYRFAVSSDGINFTEINSIGISPFTPASIYFYWYVNHPAFPTKQTTTIDWVRTF